MVKMINRERFVLLWSLIDKNIFTMLYLFEYNIGYSRHQPKKINPTNHFSSSGEAAIDEY